MYEIRLFKFGITGLFGAVITRITYSEMYYLHVKIVGIRKSWRNEALGKPKHRWKIVLKLVLKNME
jgi:hypothetical protein